MKIIVHLPATQQGMLELQQIIASLHAEAAGRQITKLTCSKKQKATLIDAIARVSAEHASPPIPTAPR